MSQKFVVITGCSAGGIGAALATEYVTRGYHVFATARNTSKIPTSLTTLSTVTALTLDVTSQKSIDEAVKQVSDLTSGRLNVLVNNSGTALSSPVLDTDVDVARSMFEVNVLGLLAVTKAFAALLVRSEHACIVNISSINGETNLPFTGVYGASKAASTIISETLRLEVMPLGIRVVSLITGIIETNLHNNEPAHDAPYSSYYQPINGWLNDRKTGRNRPPGMSAEAYAQAVVQKVEAGAHGKVYVGNLTPLFTYLHWWMPTWIWDRFLLNSGPKDFHSKISAQVKTAHSDGH